MTEQVTSSHVIMGLSGGMDSTTLLGELLSRGHSVHCVFFNYGSKHNPYEKMAVEDVVAYYSRNFSDRVVLQTLDLTSIFVHFKSNLLIDGGAIPEGHYAEESMRKTVVPGRNGIMISIMAGLGKSVGASDIALGVHSGDHHIYPDCRPDFISAMRKAVYLSEEIGILTPFLHLDKHRILVAGHDHVVPAPYQHTRTCYKHQGASCGKCGSCNERLEAWELLGKEDPIPYRPYREVKDG